MLATRYHPPHQHIHPGIPRKHQMSQNVLTRGVNVSTPGDDIMSYYSLHRCSDQCTAPARDDLQFCNFTAVKGQLNSDSS